MALVLGFVLAACMVVYIAVCYVFTKFITLKYERNATDYKIMTVGAAIGVFAFVFYFLVFTPFLSAGGGVALPPSAGAGIGLAEGGRTPGQEEATTPDEEDIDPFDKDKDGKLDKKERKHKEKEERKKHKERQSSDPPTQTHPAPPQHPQQVLRRLFPVARLTLSASCVLSRPHQGCSAGCERSRRAISILLSTTQRSTMGVGL